MIPHKLKVVRLPNCVVDKPILPPARTGDVGYDLCANIDEVVTVPPHSSVNIGTGIAVEIELKWPFAQWIAGLFKTLRIQGEIRPRSSTFYRRKLDVSIGTIDIGYRGELSTCLINPTPEPVHIYPGDYLSQLVITTAFAPDIEFVQELSESDRGASGFGSTGGYDGKPKQVA